MSLFGNNSQQPKPSLFSTPSTQAGGLFGGQQAATPATGGLFGSLGSSVQPQQQQSSGLFGGLGSTTQSPAGGLFGATSQLPQTGGGGLFGGLGATTQPQQSATTGLFGGPGGGSTQPQQQQGGGSLFGGLGASTQPQQQPQQGAGLFGGLGASTQPGASLFDASSQSQQNPQPGTTDNYFDSILENSRKRALGEIADEDLPQLQLGLGDLRQRIKRLNSGAKDRAADGRAHYLLAASGVDPGAAVRDLNAFSTATGRSDRPRAYDAPDTDVETYLQNLQTQTTLSMISDGLARSVRDFDAFLEENVNMEWDAQRKRIYQHFGIKQKSTPGTPTLGAEPSDSQGGFGRSRRSKAAGLASSQATKNPKASAFGRSSLQRSVIGTAGTVGGSYQPLFSDVVKKIESNNITVPNPNDGAQRIKQHQYAEVVSNLNVARLQKQCLPILNEFGNVVSGGAEEHSQYLSRAYGALIEIVKEEPEIKVHSDHLAVPERKFAPDYLDEAQNSAKKVEINRRILRGSTRYLESLFLEELEAYIVKSQRDAQLGGLPGVLKKVQAYVRLKDTRKDLTPDNITLQSFEESKENAWAVVFYLIRAGAVQEAVTYVEQNGTAFKAFDRYFHQYISSYASSSDRRLERHLQDRLTSEYNQRYRVAPEKSIDPFKMACYKVLGRCDLRNRAFENINYTMNDYFWLQFVMAREVRATDEMANEVCTLTTLQTNMKEIGQRFFSKGDNYGTYVWLLVLSGLFEDAVAYLYPYAYADAVHLAIGLDYYGLLRVSDPDQPGESTLLTHTTRDLPQIKFGHMLGLYTRDFRAAHATLAVDYLTLICLNKDLPNELGQHQVSLCHEALRELVLESREFAMLLGDIRSDGQRIKGVIEKRMKLVALNETDDFMRTITIQAASVADDNGRTTDAVLLYHLAGEYDNVITIVNRALSEALAVPIGQEQMRLQPLKPRVPAQGQQEEVNSLSLTSVDDPIVLAQNMQSLYRQNKMYTQNIGENNMADCEVLIKISEARAYVQQEQWSIALDVLATCQILPIDAGGNASAIRSCANKFSALSQPVANVVPNLLMWAVVCCTKQLQNGAGAYGGNDGTHRQLVERLRQQTMDLTVYTSQLRYRFPTALHEALAIAQAG